MKKFLKAVLIVVIAIAMILYITPSVKRWAERNELNKCVISYLNETYGRNFKLKRSSFSHYDYGFTGGLYMYEFLIEDENGEQYRASYSRYFPLSESDVDDITLEKITES